ncbi:hypothetical protein AVEN_195693-1 [Araneus ventricosus]|uniref:Uncharacterized protein n=1 Tax=Araneus ventricosus TaxID=182803 RepID=A0A4Y2B9J7_ARAVE|nr:hypothetical protein AVEN_195693-1 [Araneus ventricosus]
MLLWEFICVLGSRIRGLVPIDHVTGFTEFLFRTTLCYHRSKDILVIPFDTRCKIQKFLLWESYYIHLCGSEGRLTSHICFDSLLSMSKIYLPGNFYLRPREIRGWSTHDPRYC